VDYVVTMTRCHVIVIMVIVTWLVVTGKIKVKHAMIMTRDPLHER